MRLINHREGFASNSSSMHFTHFASNREMKKYRLGRDLRFSVTHMASGRQELLRYVAAQVNANLDPGMANEYRKAIIDGLLGEAIFADAAAYSLASLGLPDDQVWKLPRARGDLSGLPNPELVRDILARVLAHENLVLEYQYGYFDDSPYDEPLENIVHIIESKKSAIMDDDHLAPEPTRLDFCLAGAELGAARIIDRDSCFCVREDGIWKFFNKANGWKTRLSFDNVPVTYKKSSTPELVDLIISNRCTQGCSFCYRDCTDKGAVAELDMVKTYIQALARLNVFEVVIGGGDILEYPDLGELLAYLRQARKLSDLSFTTTIRPGLQFSPSLRWSEEGTRYRESLLAARLKAIARVFSGVAISIDDGFDLREFLENFGHLFSQNSCQLTIQLIPEIMLSEPALEEVVSICDKAHLPLVFLGFKNTGRASTGLYPGQEAFMQKLRKSKKYLRELLGKIRRGIGMDTQFIKNFPFLKKDMENWEYTTREGKFACCIDVTSNTLYKSSYEGLDEPVRIDTGGDIALQVISGFARF